jgi:hypothetical protein
MPYKPKRPPNHKKQIKQSTLNTGIQWSKWVIAHKNDRSQLGLEADGLAAGYPIVAGRKL